MTERFYARRRTKIVCTLGPASSSEEEIGRLVEAGMDVARLNLAHSTLAAHARTIDRVRQASARAGKAIGILLDLPGPRYRCGKVRQDKVLLEKGREFTLTTRNVVGDEKMVSVRPASLPRLDAGASVYLANGAIELEVQAVTGGDLKCRVKVGGYVTRNMSVSFPGAPSLESGLTRGDKKGLVFAAERDVDFIGLSFVCSPRDVTAAKRIIRKHGKDIPVIAKIETRDAISGLNDILAVADGAMVARGDLGIEIGVEKVPMAQKEIIRSCNRLGKPVITATQMMESMVSSPLPTRAEAADVANAVLDGTDAIMLSEETAIGKYPVQTVAMMSSIAREAESALAFDGVLAGRGTDLAPVPDDAAAYAACHMARQLGAAAIVVFTSLGSTALRVSKYRPYARIIALTPYEATRRSLSLVWGVTAFQVPASATVEEVFGQSRELAVAQKIGKKGDLIVITAGLPLLQPGKTNLVKIEELD